jgi:hypothetical protein
MMLAAGVQVKPEHFKANSQVSSKPEPISEAYHAGRLRSFWIVTPTSSHRATLHDIMVEVTSIQQLAHWINAIFRVDDHDSAHEIIKGAKMFKDHSSAKEYAQTVIARAVSNYHAKKPEKSNLKAEDEENILYRDTPFMMDDAVDHDEDKPKRSVRRVSDDDSHVAPEDEECSMETEEDAMAESTLNFDEPHPISWEKSDLPVNVRAPEDKKDPTLFKKPDEVKPDTDSKIKVPAKMKTKLREVIAQLEKDFERAAVQDKNATGFYPTAIEVFQALLDDLEEGTVDSMKRAQITVGKLSDVFLHKIPADVLLFISKGGESRALKDIFTLVQLDK